MKADADNVSFVYSFLAHDVLAYTGYLSGNHARKRVADLLLNVHEDPAGEVREDGDDPIRVEFHAERVVALVIGVEKDRPPPAFRAGLSHAELDKQPVGDKLAGHVGGGRVAQSREAR